MLTFLYNIILQVWFNIVFSKLLFLKFTDGLGSSPPGLHKKTIHSIFQYLSCTCLVSCPFQNNSIFFPININGEISIDIINQMWVSLDINLIFNYCHFLVKSCLQNLNRINVRETKKLMIKRNKHVPRFLSLESYNYVSPSTF